MIGDMRIFVWLVRIGVKNRGKESDVLVSFIISMKNVLDMLINEFWWRCFFEVIGIKYYFGIGSLFYFSMVIYNYCYFIVIE